MGSAPSGWCQTCGQPFDRRAFCPACHVSLGADEAVCTNPRCKLPRPANEGWFHLPIRFENDALLKQAGRGFLTVVYQAYSSARDTIVAIKMPYQAGRAPGMARKLEERFTRECRHLQLFRDYPEILRALDHGTTSGGVPFLVMENVKGSTLDQILGPHSEGGDPLNPVRRVAVPYQRTMRVLRRLMVAMGRMHHHKLIHRDLKPSNIFLANSDQGEMLKLGDLGMATTISISSSSAAGGAPEELVPGDVSPSSATYMSPEQVRGERALKPCSDIYSVGVMAHELLTGRLPYQVTESVVNEQVPILGRDFSPKSWGAFTAGWLKAHLVADRVDLAETWPDIPAAVADFLDQCLARDPRDRIQTTGEFNMQLALIEQELARVTQPVASAPPAPSVPPAQSATPIFQSPPLPPSPVPEVSTGPSAEVIQIARERDRLALEVKQLRAALEVAHKDLKIAERAIITAHAECRKLREKLKSAGPGSSTAPADQQRGGIQPRKTKFLQQEEGQQPNAKAPAPRRARAQPSRRRPSRTPLERPTSEGGDMNQTLLDGDLHSTLSREPEGGHRQETGPPATPVRRPPISAPLMQTQIDETILNKMEQAFSVEESLSMPPPDGAPDGSRDAEPVDHLRSTRFDDPSPGGGSQGSPPSFDTDPAEKAITDRHTSVVSQMVEQSKMITAKQQQVVSGSIGSKDKGAGAARAAEQPFEDMQTKILEGTVEEDDRGLPTSVISEEELLGDSKKPRR